MGKTSNTGMWIESYWNHIIYSSAYTGIAACCLKAASTSDGFDSRCVLSHCGAVVAGLLWFGEVNYIFSRSRLPRGDSGLPLIGDLVSFLSGAQEFFQSRVKRFGSLSTFNLLMRPVILVSDEKDVSFWLTQERKGNAGASVLPHIKALTGHDAIMFQIGDRHRQLRRIFEPTFAPGALKNYVGTIDKITMKELEKWSSNDSFNASEEWSFFAMRLFFECAFGEGIIDDAILRSIDQHIIGLVKGLFALFPYPLPGNCLYKAYRSRADLHALFRVMIQDFKAKHPEGEEPSRNSMMGRLCYGSDDKSKGEGSTLTEQQLLTNLQFILYAGYDTTKGSFCAFAHYLAEMPELCEMLREEVATFSEPLTVDELKAAPLLNAFMAETWRIMAPLYAHQVETLSDVVFKDYTVKKGTFVMLDIQNYNAGEEGGGHYRNPTEFHVERWLPESHPLHDPEYYQAGVDYNIMSVKYRAFNFGSHMCLGGHFAKLEARVLLTRILQGYDIEVQNESIIKFPLRQYKNEFLLKKRS